MYVGFCETGNAWLDVCLWSKAVRLLHPIQPDVAIQSPVFFPVRLDLDVQKQVNLAAQADW